MMAGEAMDGGTARVLPAERAKASFNVEQLMTVIDGGTRNSIQRRFIQSSTDGAKTFVHSEVEREELVAHGVKHFMGVHAPHLKRGYKPKEMDMSYMSDARMTSSMMGLHFGVFASTLRSQCSDEQKRWWLEPSQRGEMFGCCE